MSTVVVEPDVEIAAKRLTRAAHAEAVLLFGSRARGDHRPDGDWDLCLILPDEIRPQQFTPSKLWALLSDIDASIQVHPLRRSVFEANKHVVGSLSHEIDRDGYIICEACTRSSSDASAR